MRTAKVQMKRALFTFLTLLLFGTVMVHSSDCSSKITATTQKLTDAIAKYADMVSLTKSMIPSCLSDPTVKNYDSSTSPKCDPNNPDTNLCTKLNSVQVTLGNCYSTSLSNQRDPSSAGYKFGQDLKTASQEITALNNNPVASCGDTCCDDAQRDCLTSCKSDCGFCGTDYDACTAAQTKCKTSLGLAATAINGVQAQFATFWNGMQSPLSTAYLKSVNDYSACCSALIKASQSSQQSTNPSSNDFSKTVGDFGDTVTKMHAPNNGNSPLILGAADAALKAAKYVEGGTLSLQKVMGGAESLLLPKDSTSAFKFQNTGFAIVSTSPDGKQSISAGASFGANPSSASSGSSLNLGSAQIGWSIPGLPSFFVVSPELKYTYNFGNDISANLQLVVTPVPVIGGNIVIKKF